jgi:hypothetical protein
MLCDTCVHRMDVPGSAHSCCNNFDAQVTAKAHGVTRGWFKWPFNFDPVWLIDCTGHATDAAQKMPKLEGDPLMELLAMLG